MIYFTILDQYTHDKYRYFKGFTNDCKKLIIFLLISEKMI